MKRPLLHPRDEIMQTMERIYRFRMTTTSGGNLSILDGHGDLWITPAGVDKGSLRREDIMCVHPDGSVEGPHRPSSELPFHRAIYAARPDLRGIVHAHPVALVACSICARTPDTRLFPQARQVCGAVGFAPYALPGSRALADRIAAAFAAGPNCVMLENHGVVTAGSSLQKAFQRFETLEFTAKTLIKAGHLGESSYLSDEQVELPHRTFQPLPEFQPATPTSRELELRRQLCDFVRRSYEQRLMISTEGSFSARLDEGSFLITPYQMDRRSLGLDDIVLVSGGRREEGKQPSRAARVHAAIYARHRGIGSLVNAYTVNANAFSVTGRTLDSRTIPESYILLREVGTVPFELPFERPEELAGRLSLQRPILLLRNNGVLVAGRHILDAYDRLEVLEATAEAVINSRAVGEITAMDDQALRDIEKAFPLPEG